MQQTQGQLIKCDEDFRKRIWKLIGYVELNRILFPTIVQIGLSKKLRIYAKKLYNGYLAQKNIPCAAAAQSVRQTLPMKSRRALLLQKQYYCYINFQLTPIMQECNLATQQEIQQIKNYGALDPLPIAQSGQATLNLYADKLSSHLEFMKKEFQSSFNLQKDFIKQLQTRETKNSKQNREGDRHKLQLTQAQETFLKELLLKQIMAPKKPCDLKTLIGLAISVQTRKSKRPSIKYFQSELQVNQQQEVKGGSNLQNEMFDVSSKNNSQKQKYQSETALRPIVNKQYEKRSNENQIMFAFPNGPKTQRETHDRPLLSMINFLDKENKAKKGQQGTLQTSIQKHIYQDYGDNCRKYSLDNQTTPMQQSSDQHLIKKASRQNSAQNLSLLCSINCCSNIIEGEKATRKLDQSSIIMQIYTNLEKDKHQEKSIPLREQPALCFRKNITRKIGKIASKNNEKAPNSKQSDHSSSKITILKDTFRKTWEIFNNVAECHEFPIKQIPHPKTKSITPKRQS